VKLETFKNAFRVRAGDYRVIYVVDDEAEVVTITKFGHRGSVYRRG
jgi:mRNA interferase RelE/StbE